MDMCPSGDISHAKLYEIIGDVEGSKKYINNILILIKDNFTKYLEHIVFIFYMLCNVGLKVNYKKFSFVIK